jgi:hypothetical protein
MAVRRSSVAPTRAMTERLSMRKTREAHGCASSAGPRAARTFRRNRARPRAPPPLEVRLPLVSRHHRPRRSLRTRTPRRRLRASGDDREPTGHTIEAPLKKDLEKAQLPGATQAPLVHDHENTRGALCLEKEEYNPAYFRPCTAVMKTFGHRIGMPRPTTVSSWPTAQRHTSARDSESGPTKYTSTT